MSGLHADSIIKSFGNKQILTDIFLTCNIGEVVGLLGRNGSGKSTLMKIIFGSLDADSKFIKVDNKIISRLYDSRNLVNYLPQHSFLPDNYRIGRIIKLFCNKENALKVEEDPIIKPLISKKCRQLSGGEKRLLEIFLIIYSNAKYILIDEPFNGVAPLHKEIVKRCIAEQSANKGFIITDHDYRNILDIASRILILHDGAICEIEKTKDDLIQWGYLPE